MMTLLLLLRSCTEQSRLDLSNPKQIAAIVLCILASLGLLWLRDRT